MLLLSSCQQDAVFIQHETKNQIIPFIMNGITLITKDILISKDKPMVEITIQNTTPHGMTYSAYYAIEQQENGMWYTIERIDIKSAFVAKGYILPAYSTVAQTYNLAFYKEYLVPGTYRLIKIIEDTQLAIEFEIID
jgi:hypothetical protein